MDKQHIRKFTSAEGKAIARFVFAHGAGAGMDSDFMADMAAKLAAQGVEVWRFNFPYMQQMSESAKRKPPNRMPALLKAYAEELELQQTDLPLFIGGKSMGGRASTLLVAEAEYADGLKDKVKGVMVLGYPFHPAGKPEKLRLDHLPDMRCPALIVQGERDTMGNREEVAGYSLPNTVEVDFVDDGDHSLKPRKASGFTLEQNLNKAVESMLGFIKLHK